MTEKQLSKFCFYKNGFPDQYINPYMELQIIVKKEHSMTDFIDIIYLAGIERGKETGENEIASKIKTILKIDEQ